MNETIKTISERSSIRKYTAEPVSEEDCKTLIEAGLMAPTATNRQEIHFTVVKGNDPVNREIQNDLNPEAETTFYYDAPLVMYLSGEDTFGWSDVDAGIAVENIHLAAKSLGLGSLVIGCVKKVLNGDKKAEYDRKLQIPEGYSFRIAIAIGHPDTTKQQHFFDFEKNVSIL
ncbi:MAG: nitroreductase family protein [Erysipelotrichaceae bacterium]|nr:nitroreductase family protein [Erysipelotrichaceae bacterium]